MEGDALYTAVAGTAVAALGAAAAYYLLGDAGGHRPQVDVQLDMQSLQV